jgi:hypothetical protein
LKAKVSALSGNPKAARKLLNHRPHVPGDAQRGPLHTAVEIKPQQSTSHHLKPRPNKA